MKNDSGNRTGTEDLIAGHFDGTLNEEQEKELAAMLASSAEAEQLFLSYMRMEGRLHSLGRDGFLREPFADTANDPESPAQESTDVSTLAGRGRQRLRLLAASSLAVCAAIMLILLPGILWSSSVNANSVLQRAQQAAAELIDRTYRVTVSNVKTRSQASELTINVRGGGRFLVRPVDGDYVIGSDGTEYWMAQQGGPDWVAANPRLLAPKLRRVIPNRWVFGIASAPDEPLLLDLPDVLKRIKRKHDVELIDSASPAEHHVRATLRVDRRNTTSSPPERIDFWVDAETGVGLRAELKWGDGRQIRLDLIESVQLPSRWYHHSEHASGRNVKRLDVGSRL